MNPAEATIDCNHYPKRNVLSLEQLWKDKRSSNQQFQKEFTQKDRGMLRHFIRFVAPHDPYAVMGTVLKNWSQYADSVRYTAGLCGVPSQPSIPFLLKYCEQAVNYHLHQAKYTMRSVVNLTTPPKPVLMEEAEFEGQITLEEIEALEAQWALGKELEYE